MKLARGSTPFFTITLLCFEDLEEAAKAEHRIAELRAHLHLPPGFEFHFNTLSEKFRAAFLRAVSPIEFFYFAATIKKADLPEGTFDNPDEFYRYACGLAFESAKPYLSNASIIIDATGGQNFRQELSTYLYRRAATPEGEKIIRKIKFDDSAKNSLVQMADVICGAVARVYSGKPEPETLRKLVLSPPDGQQPLASVKRGKPRPYPSQRGKAHHTVPIRAGVVSKNNASACYAVCQRISLSPPHFFWKIVL